MASKQQLDDTYMGQALLYAKMSKARRKRVGCTLVTPVGITISSFNGTPSGTDNTCEGVGEDGELYTFDWTLHSEDNTVAKCARMGVSTEGSTMYVSLSPCAHCCALMIQAGIKELVYLEEYRDVTPLDMLRSCGIIVRKYQNALCLTEGYTEKEQT